MAFNDFSLRTDSPTFEPAQAGQIDRKRDGFYARRGKRLLDLALSFLMLPVLIPVMAAIWLFIRRDGGMALFSQQRVGRNGKTFACYKFRSMVTNAERALEEMCANDPAIAAEWNTYQKLRHDPRVTRIGSFLRKTSLDELPQIINVLKGDMSLVGPRPFMLEQRAIYDKAGGQAYYHLRPGVTGLWQVTSRHDTTFAARVVHDESYATNVSALRDLSLILGTTKVVLFRSGS